MYYGILVAHAKNCGNPADKIEEAITVISQNVFPVMEGANVTFSCPPGQVLIGSNIVECMENGEWEPDPKEVKCSGEFQEIILCMVKNVFKTSANSYS